MMQSKRREQAQKETHSDALENVIRKEANTDFSDKLFENQFDWVYLGLAGRLPPVPSLVWPLARMTFPAALCDVITMRSFGRTN